MGRFCHMRVEVSVESMNCFCTIVIVSYNCRQALQTCLLKLIAEGYPPPILVVDNASTDGTAKWSQPISLPFSSSRTPRTTVLLRVQPGHPGVRFDFILLLNPDTLLKRATLQKLSDIMRSQPNIGASGPRVLNTDGSLQSSCRRFPTLGAMACDELGFSRLFPHTGVWPKYRMHGWPHDETATSIN